MARQEPDNSKYPLPDWAVALILSQAIALMLAIIIPVTPSKTGSPWSPADFVFDDPSYLQEATVIYVLVNGVMALLGGYVLIATKWGKSQSGE